jgi:transposase-like protein
MRKRSHFTAELNRQRVEQTCQPGNSIAGLAQAHGINANQLHKWPPQDSSHEPATWWRSIYP